MSGADHPTDSRLTPPRHKARTTKVEGSAAPFSCPAGLTPAPRPCRMCKLLKTWTTTAKNQGLTGELPGPAIKFSGSLLKIEAPTPNFQGPAHEIQGLVTNNWSP